MTTISVSLPEPLEAFAHEQAQRQGFADAGEYLMALLDAHRQAGEELEVQLLQGLDSAKITATPEFWSELRTEANRNRERVA